MKRSFNYTGRRRIDAKAIRITLLHHASEPVPSFSADLSGLASLELDPQARVYLEATVGQTSMRFPFGIVAAPSPPASTLLTDIDAGPDIVFRLKIVDEASDPRRIVGSADHLRPVSEDDGKRSILPLHETRSLGEDLWQLSMPTGSRPCLLINSRVPDLAEKVRTDKFVQGLVMPHAFKLVLGAMLLEEDPDEDEEWVQDWIKFATELAGDWPEDDDRDIRVDYIARCVEAFCNRLKFGTNCSTREAGADD